MITLQQRVHGILPPTDWSPRKLHHVFRVRKGNKNVGMITDNLLSLSYGRIVPKDIDSAEGLLPESFETYQIVQPGDIVLRLTDLQNDKRSLRQGLVRERGIVTSAYDALEVAKSHDPHFWAFGLLALDLAKYYYSLGGGVRQSIKFSDFPNDWIATPDLGTQQTIADFLDRETARIDQLIEKKRHFVNLVEAEFEARITLAVTVGWPSRHDLKPAVHDWAPHIPRNWDITRLKFLCANIVDCLHETPEHNIDGEYPSVRTADIKRGAVLLDQAKLVSEAEYRHRIQRLEPKQGDILFTREGERFGLAAMVPVGARLCLGQRMMMFRTNKKVHPEYLMWSLNGMFAYNYLKQDTAGATSPHLNIFNIRNVPIFLPPIDEQKRICSELGAAFEKKERLVQLTKKTIGHLVERRSALITAAVTGQINVETWSRRGYADRQLDQIEEAMRA